MKALLGDALKFDRFSSEFVGLAFVAGAVWLAWEIVKIPVTERGGAAIAVRLAPGSPEVLRRAAESELAANRNESALSLSNESISRAPFNARALRVRGLAEARIGQPARADEMLTLAGNWSLRDDPTHAWLVEYRLRRGDYGSAFAHADTLVRRRPAMYSRVFELFTQAAIQDTRSLPVLVRLLAAGPPWRAAYLDSLYRREDGAALVAALAIALEQTSRPFTALELQHLYTTWAQTGRLSGLAFVRSQIARPPLNELIQNGDFDIELEDQLYPFGWRMGSGPGMSTSVTEEDGVRNRALRVEYNSFGSTRLTEQLLLLPPGTYVLSGRDRMESDAKESRLAWQIRCAETDENVAAYIPSGATAAQEWRTFNVRFSVPRTHCSAQWIRLEPNPTDTRKSLTIWFDDVAIKPVG